MEGRTPDQCRECWHQATIERYRAEGLMVGKLKKPSSEGPISKRISLCIHLGKKLDTGHCVGKCWHNCDAGHGAVGKTRPAIECKSCGYYDPDGDGEPGPLVNLSTANLSTSWPIRFDETNLAPGQPGKRFNSSLIANGNGYLLAYRDGWAGSRIHIATLDKEFKPVGSPIKLNLDHIAATYGHEDPRLFRYRGQLHVAFIGVIAIGPKIDHTNVLYARLSPSLAVEEVVCPQIPGRSKWEKNHFYFEHADTLYAGYSISPNHRILRINGDGANWAYETTFNGKWNGGEMRGGAAPVRVGNEFYHFFHSRSRYDAKTLYEIGLLTFEAKPPFRITRCTPEPIMIADPKTKPKSQYVPVVFPCGSVLVGGDWVVSIGIHDRWTELHRWSFDELEKKLVRIA